MNKIKFVNSGEFIDYFNNHFMEIESIISMDFLRDNFMQYYDEESREIIKPKLRFNNIINIRKTKINEYLNNSCNDDTTIGKLLFNLFCLPNEYFKKFGYVNETIVSKNYKQIHENLTILKLEKNITDEEYANIIDKLTWLGFNLTNFKGYAINMDVMEIPEEVTKRKNELLSSKENFTGEEIDKIEKELINIWKKHKGNTGLAKIISSGAKGNFENHIKNMFIMRGLVKTPDGMKLIKSNLLEGNNFEDSILLSNNSIEGSSGRAIKTAVGGYLVKLITAGFSVLALGEDDCRSTVHLEIDMNEKNFKLFMYRNIKLRGETGYQELTHETKNNYMGKKVLIRSPMYCHSKHGICKKCYGNLYKYNEITEGLNTLISDLGSVIMNKSMKSFHDLTIKYKELDFQKLLQ
jgi:hypothetical protein